MKIRSIIVGCIAAYSGSTLVLVDGATTANFIRGPSESTIVPLSDQVIAASICRLSYIDCFNR